MKKMLTLLAIVILVATGCAQGTPVPTEAPAPTQTSLPPTDTPTSSPEPSPTATVADYGPVDFPPEVNPLTGLHVSDPSLLERRPILVKISNLPRHNRPQWGLSLADIVYEYYTEEGTTRFSTLFYGNDAEMVGPVRSARFIDVHLVKGYDAVFVFGLAYIKVLDRLYSSGFTDRLVIEGSSTPLFRYDPAGYNHLMVNTAELSAYITEKGVENGRQNLDGMAFQLEAPQGGQAVSDVYVRYSGAIYNRWQYDPAQGKYLRFADTVDDHLSGMGEEYAQSSDSLTGEMLAFDNVVVLYVQHDYYADEVWDIQLIGSGRAYIFRDGQVYETMWQRPAQDAVVSLVNPDGTPFPFKPGTTWFEVIGYYSELELNPEGWRFKHYMP